MHLLNLRSNAETLGLLPKQLPVSKVQEQLMQQKSILLSRLFHPLRTVVFSTLPLYQVEGQLIADDLSYRRVSDGGK